MLLRPSLRLPQWLPQLLLLLLLTLPPAAAAAPTLVGRALSLFGLAPPPLPRITPKRCAESANSSSTQRGLQECGCSNCCAYHTLAECVADCKVAYVPQLQEWHHCNIQLYDDFNGAKPGMSISVQEVCEEDPPRKLKLDFPNSQGLPTTNENPEGSGALGHCCPITHPITTRPDLESKMFTQGLHYCELDVRTCNANRDYCGCDLCSGCLGMPLAALAEINAAPPRRGAASLRWAAAAATAACLLRVG